MGPDSTQRKKVKAYKKTEGITKRPGMHGHTPWKDDRVFFEAMTWYLSIQSFYMGLYFPWNEHVLLVDVFQQIHYVKMKCVTLMLSGSRPQFKLMHVPDKSTYKQASFNTLPVSHSHCFLC